MSEIDDNGRATIKQPVRKNQPYLGISFRATPNQNDLMTLGVCGRRAYVGNGALWRCNKVFNAAALLRAKPQQLTQEIRRC
jgi:hypothetical protein